MLCLMGCRLFSGAFKSLTFLLLGKRAHGYCKEVDSVEKSKGKIRAA